MLSASKTSFNSICAASKSLTSLSVLVWAFNGSRSDGWRPFVKSTRVKSKSEESLWLLLLLTWIEVVQCITFVEVTGIELVDWDIADELDPPLAWTEVVRLEPFSWIGGTGISPDVVGLFAGPWHFSACPAVSFFSRCFPFLFVVSPPPPPLPPVLFSTPFRSLRGLSFQERSYTQEMAILTP